MFWLRQIGFASSIALASFFLAPAAARAEPVAFVTTGSGVSEPLASVVAVLRNNHPVPVDGAFMSLEQGDVVYLRKPKVTVIVHYLADNAVYPLKRNAVARDGEAVHTVAPVRTASLGKAAWDWLVGQLWNSNRAQDSLTIAGGRGDGSDLGHDGGCGPDPGAAPRPGNEASDIRRLGPGKRSIVVARGTGAGPFSVKLVRQRSGAVLAEAQGASDACFVRLDDLELAADRYSVTVTLSDGSPRTFVIDATAAPPPVPAALENASLDALSRKLYYATWLSAQDDGAWAFEAQQEVLGEDCSRAVNNWLAAARLEDACRQ